MKTSSIPKIEIPVITIKSIDEVDKSNYKNGIYWFPNPHSTSYIFCPRFVSPQIEKRFERKM
jgi:hypothetical protein